MMGKAEQDKRLWDTWIWKIIVTLKKTVAFDTGIIEKMTFWLLFICLNFYIK